MGKCRAGLAIPLIARRKQTEYQPPYFLIPPHVTSEYDASDGFGFLQELLTIPSRIAYFNRSAFVIINHIASLAKAFSIVTKGE